MMLSDLYRKKSSILLLIIQTLLYYFLLVPALMKEGICIVVSPLIALMQDQVEHLRNKGIKAIALTSGIKYSELDTLLDNCIYGNYKFLYLSPERLQQDIVKERLKRMNINLIAIDEAHCISQWGAHCISQWGNDFRPSYRKIKVLSIKRTAPCGSYDCTNSLCNSRSSG